LTFNIAAQSPAQTPAAPAQSDISEQLRKLQDALEAQQKQIAAQQEQIAEQKKELERLKQQQAAPALVSAPAGTRTASPQLVNADLRTPTAPAPAQQDSNQAKESPLSFRIGSTEFTPGGFVDFENVFRTTNSGSIVTTNFGSIPFNSTTQGQMTEFRMTAQFSRLNLKVTGKHGVTDITGYFEMDFNGNDAANGFVTGNSHTFRERLAFANVRRHNWEFLGGQTWSWLTPNRRGIGPMPSDLALTYNEDGNAQAGIPYTRASEFRVVYHPNNNWAAGIGIENPEQFTGIAPGEVVFPTDFAQQLNSQFDPNNTTNTTPNLMPDILAKAGYDTDLSGRHFHAEVVGLMTTVKTTVQPVGGAFDSNTKLGGGIGAAFNVEPFRNVRVLANALYTSGGGRYLIGLGPNAIVLPDGTPSLVHSGTGLVGVEYVPWPKTQLGAYYGAVYFQRNFALDTSAGAKPNSFIGFGGPNSAGTNNRTIQEPTFDWTQTFWRNPQYGAVNLVTQTSYLTRSPWFVAPGAPKNAHLLMVYTSIRYVLP